MYVQNRLALLMLPRDDQLQPPSEWWNSAICQPVPKKFEQTLFAAVRLVSWVPWTAGVKPMLPPIQPL